MRTYPIMLVLSGRRATVVGGGPVGLRKVRSLLAADAEVTWVAEQFCQEAAQLARNQGKLKVVRRQYGEEDFRGALLVFACTDDRDVNVRIAADARRAGALVNVADQAEECDFLAPAVLSDGDVLVAIGTGGAAPALVHMLKGRLAEALPQGIGDFAALLQELRNELKQSVSEPARRAGIMKQLSDEQSFQAFLRQGAEALKSRMRQLIAGG